MLVARLLENLGDRNEAINGTSLRLPSAILVVFLFNNVATQGLSERSCLLNGGIENFRCSKKTDLRDGDSDVRNVQYYMQPLSSPIVRDDIFADSFSFRGRRRRPRGKQVDRLRLTRPMILVVTLLPF